jgi:mRNA interferase MazF
LATVIVAPLTTRGHAYPFRVACRFQRKTGQVVLDQLRTIDTERLVRRLGRLPSEPLTLALATLREMFAN